MLQLKNRIVWLSALVIIAFSGVLLGYLVWNYDAVRERLAMRQMNHLNQR